MSNNIGSACTDEAYNSSDNFEELSFVTLESNECLFWPPSQHNTDVGAAINESQLTTSNDPTELNNGFVSQCARNTTNSDQLESIINETIWQPNQLEPLVNYQEFYSNDSANALSPVVPAFPNSQSTPAMSNEVTYPISNYAVSKLKNSIYVPTTQYKNIKKKLVR